MAADSTADELAYWVAKALSATASSASLPQPHTSSSLTDEGLSPALSVASRITRPAAWARVLADPKATPRITPRILFPAARASGRRLSTSTTAPSPGTRPSRRASSMDSGVVARVPAIERPSKASKSRCRWPAAHTTASHSPWRRMSVAAEIADRLEQSPASKARAPPIRSNDLVRRLASVLEVKLPVSSTIAGNSASTFFS